MSKRAEAEALFFAGNGQMADGDLAGAEASFRAAASDRSQTATSFRPGIERTASACHEEM